MWFKLFFSFIKIGFLSMGGAYSFLPLFEKELVESHGWITREEFLDVLGVAELAPGAISIKFATYTGFKLLGIPGAILANFGNLLPPALTIMAATALYTHYKNVDIVKGAFAMIKLSVIAMIFSVALKMIDWGTVVQFKPAIVVVVSFILFYFFKIHPAIVILLAGVIGFLRV